MTSDLKSLVILFKAQQSLENVVKQSLEKTSLSINEFTAMEALNTKGSLNTKELADYVLIPNSSMTYVLDNLTKKELVSRKRSPEDRRIQLIELTQKGKTVFDEIYQIHFTHMRPVFDVLDENEELQMQESLKKIGKTAQKNLETTHEND